MTGVGRPVPAAAPSGPPRRPPPPAPRRGERPPDPAARPRRLDGVPGVSGIEVNISCPNVEDGLEFGTDPRAAAEVTNAVRRRTTLPVTRKLTPTAADIGAVARAVVAAGADALPLINPSPAMAIDTEARRP